MKSFKRYLIPSLISTLLFSSFALIDGIFIGGAIGDKGLSAINIAWPITAFIQAIGTALGLSGGIFISRLEGKKEYERASKIRHTTIILIFLVSIVIGAILYVSSYNLLRMLGAKDETLVYGNDYIKVIILGSSFQMLGCGLIPLLKNSNMVKTSMVISIISVITNLSLDYLFIVVLGGGLKGAAFASIIGQAIPTVIGLVIFFRNVKGFDYSFETLRELFLGSIAPFVLIYSYSFIIIIFNFFCLKNGGDEAVAAYTLLSYLLYISQSLATATGDAIQPLFSYYNEKKDYKRNKKYLIKCLAVSFSLNVVFSILVLVFRDNLAILYNLSDKAVSYYDSGLPFFIIGFIVLSLYKVICSYTYSINEKFLSNVLVIFEPVILTPILIVLLNHRFELIGVWLSFPVAQMILLLIAIYIMSIIERRVLVNGWVYSSRQA